MKELVEVIAKALVDNPDKVTVTQTVEDDGTIVLSLNVAKRIWERSSAKRAE